MLTIVMLYQKKRKRKEIERERGGGRGAEERESACKTLHASVFPRKVFKEKLRSDRNVSFVKIDGTVLGVWVHAASLRSLHYIRFVN